MSELDSTRQSITSNEPASPSDVVGVPEFGTTEWGDAVRQMVDARAPRRFGVVAHDPTIENSAVLAWGFDYGDGEVIVDSVRDDRRWTLTAVEEIRNHFPHAPIGGLEILWIDGPPASPS